MGRLFYCHDIHMKGKETPNVLVDRIAKLTAAHYLSAVEYELSKRTETQIRCTLLKLFHEKKYWEAAGILMEIFKELEDEGAQELLVILNSERTEANGRGFLEGFLEYTGIFWDRNLRAVPDKWAS